MQITEDQYKQWIPLNEELIELSEKLSRGLEAILIGHLDVMIVNTFLRKGLLYLKAIKLLAEKELWEPAIPIARVLIEHRITFDYFLQMFASDAERTCHKFIDSLTLNTIKQQKSIDFKGLDKIKGGPQREQLLEEEMVIARKYKKEEFKLMKKYGFTGLSVEERAKETDLHTIYNYFYRLFSSSVHQSDLLYYDLPHSSLEESALNDVYQTWKNVIQYYAHWSVGGIAEGANWQFKLGFEENLIILGNKVEELKSRPILNEECPKP